MCSQCIQSLYSQCVQSVHLTVSLVPFPCPFPCHSIVPSLVPSSSFSSYCKSSCPFSCSYLYHYIVTPLSLPCPFLVTPFSLPCPSPCHSIDLFLVQENSRIPPLSPSIFNSLVPSLVPILSLPCHSLSFPCLSHCP